MIKNSAFNNGWCKFEIGSYFEMPSYLTDVPNDLLDAFLSYFECGNGVATFDCERGCTFSLVLTEYDGRIFIVGNNVREGNLLKLYEFSEFDVEDLATELIEDIESDIKGWAMFVESEDENLIELKEALLEDKIKRLKAELRKENKV